MDSKTAHSQALQEQHRALDREIMEEQRRPFPDTVKLQHLKKRKLSIKEEIARLSGPVLKAV